jgi:hypothetical protein
MIMWRTKTGVPSAPFFCSNHAGPSHALRGTRRRQRQVVLLDELGQAAMRLHAFDLPVEQFAPWNPSPDKSMKICSMAFGSTAGGPGGGATSPGSPAGT